MLIRDDITNLIRIVRNELSLPYKKEDLKTVDLLHKLEHMYFESLKDEELHHKVVS